METITRSGDGGIIRVVLTGSESTGKSVLANQLSQHYGAVLVPEFVRGFAVRKGAPIEFADTDEIARGQIALENEHRARASGLLIQDTDLLSTAVYSGHYYGECPDWIRATARDRRPDLYLLLEIDVPWIRDEVRDRGDRRDEMQQLFRSAVAESGAPYVVVQGTWDDRIAIARSAIDRLLSESKL
jgi:HTH-type transcriptional regulator, transcriptional repressor of NAD biosynthesis genes